MQKRLAGVSAKALAPAALGESVSELPLYSSLAGVAQLVRALPCHGRGYGFESRRSRKCVILILS